MEKSKLQIIAEINGLCQNRPSGLAVSHDVLASSETEPRSCSRNLSRQALWQKNPKLINDLAGDTPLSL